MVFSVKIKASALLEFYYHAIMALSLRVSLSRVDLANLEYFKKSHMLSVFCIFTPAVSYQQLLSVQVES